MPLIGNIRHEKIPNMQRAGQHVTAVAAVRTAGCGSCYFLE
jgi:hypothetical protein